MTSRLTREMVAEARELLRLMGVPTVQAPSEGEAQAAHMAATSPASGAAASKDYDRCSSARRGWCASSRSRERSSCRARARFDPSFPKRSCSSSCSMAGASHANCSWISRCSSAPTSTTGIKGIGPKKALALVQRHGRIENMPAEIRDALGDAERSTRCGAFFCIPTSATSSTSSHASPTSTASSGSCATSASSGRDRVNAAIERTFRERSLW